MVSGTYDFDSFIGVKLAVTAGNDASATGKVLATYTINGEATGNANVAQGTDVTIEATPVNAAEWKFEKWTGTVESTENPITLKVEDAIDLKAVYTYIGRENLAQGKSVTASNNGATNTQWKAGNLTDGLYTHTPTFPQPRSIGFLRTKPEALLRNRGKPALKFTKTRWTF